MNLKTLYFLAISSALTLTVTAQKDHWATPFTSDGQPDLQGVWGNNTITPVERPTQFGDRQYLTDVHHNMDLGSFLRYILLKY